VIAPLATMLSCMPALLAQGVGVARVQVLGSAVSLASDPPRPESDQGKKSPDCGGHCNEEERVSPPWHWDHLDPGERECHYPSRSCQTCGLHEPDKHAVTVKEPGEETVAVAAHVSAEQFGVAMDHARKQFTPQRRNAQSYFSVPQ
jgi:hypothetical protein